MGSKAKKRTRSYTDRERAEVLELCAEMGASQAAAKLGLPRGTVSCWWWKHQKKGKDAKETQASATSSKPATSAEREGGKASTAQPAGAKQKRRVARKYTPSEKARALEHMAKHGVTATSRELGISRFSLYDWKRKVERAAAGLGESPTSGPDPKDLEEQRNAEILAMWKRHPGLGPSQIRNQLKRQGIKVSVKTVRDVMTDAGYRPPSSKKLPHDETFEAVRPNHLWHLDFVQRWINRCSTFTLIIIDDYSRFVVGHCVTDTERADPVIQCFDEAVNRHGKPEMVLHDKGSAFWSWSGVSRFTRLITELGIDQIPAQFKEWNGKLEVFNANLQKELFDAHHFYDVSEMRRRLASHLHWYNHQRTSHALGGLMVPADRYYGREEEVRAAMAAGTGNLPDLHTIDLRNRLMDVFHIVQRGAQTDIWLMGKKLLTLDR